MNYLLHQLLVNSAEIYPLKTAVKFGDESISYEELNSVTNRLANLLISHGVKRGDRVGIYVNKSIPSIISIFSILKAGAVYVPLDPQAPIDRIAYIIDNCGIARLLTSSLKSKVINDLLNKTECLSEIYFTDNKNELETINDAAIYDLQYILQHGEDILPENYNVSNDLAYIIYTSGSTGNPKGVMITHLNSFTFVNWVVDYLKVHNEDVFSSHAPLHFDLSILDIFCCMKVGGTLSLVPETLSMFPPRLSKWIEENKISVWYSVPSILSMMVSHGQLQERDFSRLRLLIFAGEVFPVKYLRQLMSLVKGPLFINLYGPTETNVVTYYITPEIPEEQTKPIPIGKCCENSDIFAISKEGKIIDKPGEEGELMVRGTCVAKGYWGDQEKTDKVFVKNHFQSNFNDMMYKTGDLVTLNESGEYNYVGRVDHMIKSRGYRIEIGEIESAIYAHPLIREAAVIAIPDDLITNRIKAVVSLKEGKQADASEIRQFCAQIIPKYMIPEVVEFRDKLPKTSTGKIDKPSLVKESILDEPKH